MKDAAWRIPTVGNSALLIDLSLLGDYSVQIVTVFDSVKQSLRSQPLPHLIEGYIIRCRETPLHDSAAGLCRCHHIYPAYIVLGRKCDIPPHQQGGGMRQGQPSSKALTSGMPK
jgi:hypothetical protein